MSRILTLFLAALLAAPAFSQTTYQVPAPELVALVDAPSTPAVTASPDGTTLAVLARQTLPSIEDLAADEVRLAGRRINPTRFGPSRDSYMTGVRLTDIASGQQRDVSGLPDDVQISDYSWSPDGDFLALIVTEPAALRVWQVDVADGAARPLSDRPLNASLIGEPIAWMPDGGSLVALVVPENHGPLPEAPDVPATPVIQETGEKAAPARTYQDLLEDLHDERLFEHLATGQLLRIDISTGAETPIGAADVRSSFAPSPDGRYLLVRTIEHPYSYLVPWYRFPSRWEAMELATGRAVRLANLPLAEDVPTGFDSVPTGPRSMWWRPDTGAEVVWYEAADGGDQSVEAEVRDRVFMWAAPFDQEPRVIADLAHRFRGLTIGEGGWAVLGEGWWTDRTEKVQVLDVDAGVRGRVIFEGSSEDNYADPGSPMTVPTPRGTRMLAQAGGGFYMTGRGAGPDGDHPFVHRHAFETEAVETVFRSRDPFYEDPSGFVGSDTSRLLLMRESPDLPPNYLVHDLVSGEDRALTGFPHPYPDLAGVVKKRLEYQREDGVDLSAELYLPPDYDPATDGPLPTFVWAYPREFKSAANAGQVSGSEYRFKRISYWGALPYVTRGFAVLDDAAMPIVGEGEAEPNDTFVEQLVASAQAAIDAGVDEGVVDPDRVAIGGHSYGAFMTANLLAHSDLFRAGVARSGAYNRSLTPFGFQREARTFWEAPDIYFRMSPFMNAEKVDEPILLIHGAADNNSGTFPIQSERFYHAVKGLGGTARLVMLPQESHGYRARESLLHMLWETDRWLEQHVKNAPARAGVDVQQADGP